MIKKSVKYCLATLICFSVTASYKLHTSTFLLDKRTRTLNLADSLYHQSNFQAAFSAYRSGLDSAAQQDPAVLFKTAFAAYKTGRFQQATRIFAGLKEKTYLPEWSGFFYLKSLWNIDPLKARIEAEAFVRHYSHSVLSDSLFLPMAEQLFVEQRFKRARQYFLKAKKSGAYKNETASLLIKAANCLLSDGTEGQALREFGLILKKYSSSRETLQLAMELERDYPEFFAAHFFRFINVYERHHKYTRAIRLLESHLKNEISESDRHQARYHILKINYSRRHYRNALYGFKNLLAEVAGNPLESKVRLYIARCYRKLGLRQQAIDAYLDYASRFPAQRLAAEAVWKSAWLYEAMGKSREASNTYEGLRKKWPRSKFAREAFFRQGFTLFRLGLFDQAEQVFSAISQKKWPDLDVDRTQYWTSLCREARHDTLTAIHLRLKLGRRMWDNYYTMKSYLLHKAVIDSTTKLPQKFKNTANPLNYYAAGFRELLEQFERAFLIRDLLGNSYGLIALAEIKINRNDLQHWIALAEMYKKFGAYGKSFQTYDQINYRFYGNLPYSEKTFMLRERFPYYYDPIIEEYSRRYNLEKELILAIIRQESIFRADAQSWADAYGLMQLIPATAGDMSRLARLKFTDPLQLFDPDYNIHLGSLYIKQLNKQFRGRKEHILAAYNAGPHRVKRWQKLPGSDQADVFIENIEYSETRDYVRKVLKNYWAYKLLGNDFQIDDAEIILGFAR